MRKGNYKRFLVVGCILCCLLGSLSYGRISFLDNKRQTWILRETVNARNDFGPDLTEEDAQLLQKHVFGRWEFSQKLKDDMSWDSSVDSWDIDELPGITIFLDEDMVKIEGYDENTFLEAEDAFVFTELKDSMAIKMPVYHVDAFGEEFAGYVYLKHMLEESREMEHDSEMKVVYFNLGYDRYRYPAVRTAYENRQIYINPKEEDIIYLDFCGLWKLEREKKHREEEKLYSQCDKS